MGIGNKQLNKAGNIIRNGTEEEQERAIITLNEWRANHMLPLRSIRAMVDRRLNKLVINSTIVQRLKRMSSIISKIKRFPDMAVSRMQDVGGIRIIVDNISDARTVHKVLTTNSSHEVVIPAKDYIEKPKSDGYRGIHQVFRYQSDNDDINNMRIEVQIRTKLQHAWATSVETLGVIEKISYKTGEGTSEKRSFFILASALLALEENSNVPEEYEGVSKENLIRELKIIEGRSHILTKLKGLSALNPELRLQGSGEIFYVLLLSAGENNDFQIKVIPFDDEEQAVIHYDSLERLTRGDPVKSVVLVKSQNLSELKKAYPNYFLDAALFVDTITGIIKQEVPKSG